MTKDISAEVILPTSVDVSVRKAHSITSWRTEKGARRDAAFQAYEALYEIGLVNDNLLPVRAVDPEVEEALRKVETRPGIVEVAEQIQLWPEIALKMKKCQNLQAAKVSMVRLFLFFHLNALFGRPFSDAEFFFEPFIEQFLGDEQL